VPAKEVVLQIVVRILLDSVTHSLWIEPSHLAPYFIPVLVKVDKSRCELEAIDRCQFAPDILLDVEANEQDLATEVSFELVYDGL